MPPTNHHKRLAAGVLVLATFAGAAPVSSAATHATDPRSPDAKDAAAAAQAQGSAVSRSDPRSPDARDAALVAVGRAPTRSPVAVSVADSRGFDWGDAAIGAGGAAGLLLVAGGTATLATRQRGQRPSQPGSTVWSK